MGKLRCFQSVAKPAVIVKNKEFEEPHIGIGVIPTSDGPKVAVIVRVKDGEVICDPPGGKMDPGETPQIAVLRETGEEAGYKVIVGAYLGSLPHPVKQGLERHFHEVVYVKGTPSNRVRKEHEGLMMVDPENAIALFSERIPEAGHAFIRSEEQRLLNLAQQENVIQIQPNQP